MKAICIIPARRGSKRIPDKHIRHFCGKQVIRYSIEAAFSSNLFDEIVLFTNDNAVAEIGRRYSDLTIKTRNEDNAQDEAILYRAVIECLIGYQAQYKYACVLYSCAPFVESWDLAEGYRMLSTSNKPFDVVFPIIENQFHIEQTLKRAKDGTTTMLWPRYNNINAPATWRKTYRHASQWFWCDVRKLFINKTLIPENSGSIVLPWWKGHDIDTIVDWEIAEAKYRIRHSFKT